MEPKLGRRAPFLSGNALAGHVIHEGGRVDREKEQAVSVCNIIFFFLVQLEKCRDLEALSITNFPQAVVVFRGIGDSLHSACTTHLSFSVDCYAHSDLQSPFFAASSAPSSCRAKRSTRAFPPSSEMAFKKRSAAFSWWSVTVPRM